MCMENDMSPNKTLQMKIYKQPVTEIVLQAYAESIMQDDYATNYKVVDEDGNPIDGFANDFEFDETLPGKNSLWED